MMNEIDFVFIIAGIMAVIVSYYIIHNTPVEHYKTCQYCGRKNYLGYTKDSEFKPDHLKQYRCKRCNANLFKE